MRLSSVQIFQQGISAILEQQARVNHTEQQLATGRRVLSPSDDPVAAVQILDITEDLALVDQYQRNGDLARGQLGLEELVLTDVGNLLQRTRELVVQANNASQSPETRAAIATEISARLLELQSLANTRDGSGEYIFGGFQSGTEAFSQVASQVVYNGDAGQRFAQVSSSTQVATRDSGFNVFVAVPSGNGSFDVAADGANSGSAVAGTRAVAGNFVPDTYTVSFSQLTPGGPISYLVEDSAAGVVTSGNYTSGESIAFAGANIRFDGTPANGDSFEVSPSVSQDMFATLQSIAASLGNAGAGPAQVASVNNTMGQALENLDQALNHVLKVRADVGVRLNQVDSQLNLNDSFKLQLQQSLSNVQDLDYAEAISRLNLELTALQAAQQAYVKVQGLSLFNYL